ncbi:MAG TPA: glycosyltransferase family 2 protein [Pyrinomonadaceae bacterium]|nr:glycosyltransferase family 2 protein [Pyrinomonadaceae bacterium]
MKISASIIVYNEEDNIEELCQTVDWCDEIVIVDSNSSDKTVEIAQKYTDKIFQHEFKGYKDKHEFADSKTTGDWIFWIDADERVTPELRKSVENLKKLNESGLADGYQIARTTWYLGQWIKHSGWYPDYQMRLYRKSASYWDGVSPHETARVKGKVEKLEGEFLHFTKKSLSEHHKVLDNYTNLASEYLVKNGKIVGGFGIFIYSISAFVRTYFLKQGFRDGVPGLIIAMFTAYSVFLKYAKVWEKNNVNE